MQLEWAEEQIADNGLDKSRLERLMRRLELCNKELESLGLMLYIADGAAHLHRDPVFVGQDATPDNRAIIATANTPRFDGGGW